MKKPIDFIIKLAISSSLVFIFAICLHSLEEIHYLKSFFPQTFTVKQAFYASAIELIKILIIPLPFLLVFRLGLFFLKNHKSD